MWLPLRVVEDQLIEGEAKILRERGARPSAVDVAVQLVMSLGIAVRSWPPRLGCAAAAAAGTAVAPEALATGAVVGAVVAGTAGAGGALQAASSASPTLEPPMPNSVRLLKRLIGR
jgi:hypothetical protein